MNIKYLTFLLVSGLVTIGLVTFPVIAEASYKGEKIAIVATKHMLTEGIGNQNTQERIQYSQAKREIQGYGDCSTFARDVYAEVGIFNIGNYTAEQITNPKGQFIPSVSSLQRGDLIFFASNNKKVGHWVTLPNGIHSNVSHVGIYMGDGNFIDLSNSQGTITPRSIYDSMLSDLFISGKRFSFH